MKNAHLKIFLTSTLIFVFVFSLFRTVNVRADDATPPPVATEEAVATDVPAATEEPVATDVPAATEEPVGTEVPAEEGTLAETLAELPEGTDVILLDQNGVALPLVSNEAAEVLLSGDPQWCMEGHTPADGPTFCTAAFSSFSALIAELNNGSGIDVGNGTIYIAYDYSVATAGDAGAIIFDYDLNQLNNLVFQGGWDFGTNSIVGNTVFNLSSGGSLDFWDWGGYGAPGSLTLNNVTITGGYGLYIGDENDYTTANVALNNVNVSNTEYGAYVETEGSVTVNNSSFNDNDYEGLYIETYGVLGDVTLNNVIANSNNWADDGAANAYIYTYGGDVTINNSVFNDNYHDFAPTVNAAPGCFTSCGPYGADGLFVVAEAGISSGGVSGNITLNNVTANNNGWNGATLYSDNGNINVNYSQFGGNGSTSFLNCDVDTSVCFLLYPNIPFFPSAGLLAGGPESLIQLTGVSANGNYGFGSVLEGQNIFVSYSSFDNNGLYAQYLLPGEFLYADGLGVSGFIFGDSAASVTIKCSQANKNTGGGVEIFNTLNATLDSVSASGNGMSDIFVDADTVNTLNSDCVVVSVGGDSDKKKIVDGGLPRNIVNVTSGQPIQLDCENYSGTELIFENGSSVFIPCPIKGTASIQSEDEGDLPEGAKFQSAISVTVKNEEEDLTNLSNLINISFAIPEGVDPSTVSVVYFDGTNWVTVDSFVNGDGKLQIDVNFTGTFILVSK